jgi:hypothetical protein
MTGLRTRIWNDPDHDKEGHYFLEVVQMKFLLIVLGFTSFPTWAADMLLICGPGRVTAPKIIQARPCCAKNDPGVRPVPDESDNEARVIGVDLRPHLVGPGDVIPSVLDGPGDVKPRVTVTCKPAGQLTDVSEGTLLPISAILSVVDNCKPIFGTQAGYLVFGTQPGDMVCSESGGGMITNWILPMGTSVGPASNMDPTH